MAYGFLRQTEAVRHSSLCIDGFSRHIIWMQAYFTNDNPRVIAGYYFCAVAAGVGCPQIIRSDFGTENVATRQQATSFFMKTQRELYMDRVSFKEQAQQTRE